MKSTAIKGGATATGIASTYLPPGQERDEIMVLIRLGVKIQRQHVGRRPGFLHNYVISIVSEMSEPTFDKLLAELELAALRRDSDDDHEPIERVSRSWELVTYHDPKHGEKKVTFGTIRNHLTTAKEALFTAKPNP